jgi:hypothetical protein
VAVASFEVSPDTIATDTTGDVPIVLTADIPRSDPGLGASLIVIMCIHKDQSGVANLISVDDDATPDAFYGTSLFSDGLNQYGPEIFSDSGGKEENRTGLITNGLAIGDTITLHYDAPIGSYRTYARGYTGVSINRCWTNPDEITLSNLFYGLTGEAGAVPFSRLYGDSGDSLGIFAGDAGTAGVIWSLPSSSVDPFTTDAGLMLVLAKNLLTTTVFPSGVLSWDDAGISVKEAFNDYNFGDAGIRTTMSWGEKVLAASDVISLETTPATNPTHQTYNLTGNVLRPGPGPRFCSTFRPQIYRRPNN